MSDKKPFLDHLEELRERILVSILTLIITSVLAYGFIDSILLVLLQPIVESVGNLVFLKPTEAFFTKLKCAMFGGVFLAAPVMIYHFWRFMVPALYDQERRIFFILVPLSFVLFLTGVGFAFFGVLPLAMGFLLESGLDIIQPTIGFGYYISFIMYFLLAFGMVFQLPLVIFFFIRLGLVEADFFVKNRRQAILIIFIMAAFLTPADVFSMFLMALPTLILFEASVAISRLTTPKKDE